MNEVNVTAPPFNADPTGLTDSSAAIQSAINSISAGRVVVPAGTYIAKGLVIPANVNLVGHGRCASILTSNGADATVASLNGSYCSLRDITVDGPKSGALTKSLVTIAAGITGFVVEHVIAWGGTWGIDDGGGIDGTFYDVFPAGVVGALQSRDGANKYQSCKFDTGPIAGQQRGIYFYAINNVIAENEFDQCDFSGNFSSSGVGINDGSPSAQSVARFTACTFGSVINLTRARAVMFSACEMPHVNSFSLGAGVGCSVTGSYSLGGATTYPAAVAKAGNINIT